MLKTKKHGNMFKSGFAIGYFKENSKRYLIETVPIIKAKAMYGGMEF